MNFNQTKQIDLYLTGELSGSELIVFESNLSEMREEIALHQSIIEGVKRSNQRTFVQKARRQYHLNQLLKWGSISFSTFLLSAMITYQFFGQPQKPQKVENVPLLAENTATDECATEIRTEELIKSGELVKKSFPVSFTDNKPIEFAIPSAFQVKSNYYYIDPRRDTLLKIGNEGTRIKIPKQIFIHDSGEKVQSIVRIEYKEYTNSAEIAFSGIPMIYKKQGEDLLFNSSGMFSIFGTCDGKPVEVAPNKKMTMDYALVRKNPETNFYVLKEDSSNWEFVSEIATIPVKRENNDSEPVSVHPPINVKDIVADTIEGALAWNVFDANQQVVEKEKNWHLFKNKNRNGFEPQIGWDNAEINGEFQNNPKNATLLAAGMDAGHTYPDIVRGLNVGRFGVYNCDQIYRIEHRTNVTASYVDENNNKITDGVVLSMIDLNYTGAFSFDPKQFICNPKSKVVLLLFTKDGDLYSIGHEEFTKMKVIPGSNVFKMKNVSETIKSTADLETHLGI